MLVTIDEYYTIKFYNETKEALRNNKVNFKEYISTKPPYRFYFEVEHIPKFINFDTPKESYGRWLVNLVKPLKPNEAYLYERRESYTNLKALEHYAVNDALKTGQESKQAVFFTAEREEILRISKQYPRKIFYLGRYYNKKYKVFFTDNLIIQNLLREDQILVSSKKFKHITELEVKLNYNVFYLKDRLEKMSETPYILNGMYYSTSVVPELSSRFVLS